MIWILVIACVAPMCMGEAPPHPAPHVYAFRHHDDCRKSRRALIIRATYRNMGVFCFPARIYVTAKD